jgi:hypothetical protein
MSDAVIREARLRPEHAGRYPDLEAGTWVPAAGLARLVLERGLYRNAAGPRGSDRPLPDEHFEFRGPSRPPEARPGGRSRQTDVGIAEAAHDLERGEGRLAARIDAADESVRQAEDLREKAKELERREAELRRQASDPTGRSS